MTTRVEARPDGTRVEVQTELERRASVLDAAALEIEVRGWGQYDCIDHRGAVCAVGSIIVVVDEEWPGDCCPRMGGEVIAPNDLAWAYFGGNREDLWHFNDTPRRTASEVTFLLRWRAAELRDGWDNWGSA